MQSSRVLAAFGAVALGLAWLLHAGPARAHPSSARVVEDVCRVAERALREGFRGDCEDCHRPSRERTADYPLRPRIARLREVFLLVGPPDPESKPLEALLAEFCPAPPNQPPVLEPLEPASVREGDELRVELRAEDPEGLPLRFEAELLPENARIESSSPSSATLVWRAGAMEVGEHALLIRALDEGEPPLRSEAELLVEVVPNQVPLLQVAALLEAEPGAPIELVVSAPDPDGDPVVLDAFGVPPGASFISGEDGIGSLLWSPEPGTLGRFELDFEARDDRDPPGVAAAVSVILLGNPAEATQADQVRWDASARALHVRGAAGMQVALQIEDAETGGELGTGRSSAEGAFAISQRLLRSPCAVRIRSARWLSEPMAVQGAPPDCGARALAAIRLQRAEWRSSSRELRIEAERAPADAAVDLFDADTNAPVARLRADSSGRVRYRARTDSPPCRIRVIAEGMELAPLAIDSARCRAQAPASVP